MNDRSVSNGLKFTTRIVYVLFLSASIMGCMESKEIEDTYLGYDYYPIEVGRYSIYEVEEVQYLISGFDTSRYYLRQTVFDSMSEASGVSYLVKSEVRNSDQEPWRLDSLSQIKARATFLALKENNLERIALAFPVREGKNWDANGLNNLPASNRFYQKTDSIVIDSIGLEDHIKVVLANIEPNITGVDLREEVYVRGVGLVLKMYLTQTNCTASNCGADLGKVVSGRLLKQSLLEIGYED